jgi:hypothetical protein
MKKLSSDDAHGLPKARETYRNRFNCDTFNIEDARKELGEGVFGYKTIRRRSEDEKLIRRRNI